MYLVVIRNKYRLVSVPEIVLGVLRPLDLLSEQTAYSSFCVPRDRWDKEIFKLQSG